MLATGFLSAQKSHHSLQSKEQATKAAEFDKLQVSRLLFDARVKVAGRSHTASRIMAQEEKCYDGIPCHGRGEW